MNHRRNGGVMSTAKNPLIVLDHARLERSIARVFNASQNAAAKAAGISQRTLNDLIRGRCKRIHRDTAKKLAHVLKVRLRYLTGEEPATPPPSRREPNTPKEIAQALREIAATIEHAEAVEKAFISTSPNVKPKRIAGAVNLYTLWGFAEEAPGWITSAAVVAWKEG
jgi:transcriptional regulator with XRE-family HTH domain